MKTTNKGKQPQRKNSTTEDRAVLLWAKEVLGEKHLRRIERELTRLGVDAVLTETEVLLAASASRVALWTGAPERSGGLVSLALATGTALAAMLSQWADSPHGQFLLAALVGVAIGGAGAAGAWLHVSLRVAGTPEAVQAIVEHRESHGRLRRA